MLIFIDVDGTLLTSDLRLTKHTEEVLVGLRQKGHQIVLATGRPPRSLLPYYELLGLDTPFIAYNGALAKDPKRKNFNPLSARFDRHAMMRIVGSLGDALTSCMFESEGKVYSPRKDNYLDNFFPYAGMEEVYGDCSKILDEDLYTALFLCDPTYEDKLEKSLIKEGVGYRHWRHSPYSEAYIPSVDKGSAARYVMEQLGIKKEDAIAIGDSDNDIAMLEAVGRGFMMKNFKPVAEGFPFEITEYTNDEDGLARLLEKLPL